MCSHFGRTKDECKNLRLRLHGLCCPDPAIGRSKQHEQISEQFHPLTLLQQIRHRTFAKAMDTPPRNLMNAWCAWNAYHRKIIRDDPQDFDTKLKLRRFRKRISVDWKKIGKLYPIDHEARKMRFYQRIRRLKRVEQATQRASRRKHKYARRNMAESVNNDLEPHENFLKWLNQSLRHLRGIIRFERRVLGGQRDEPAEHILEYDLRKVRLLTQRISANSLRLAQARLQHEGIPGNPNATPPNRQPSRSWYQKLGQPHRNIDHLRGGRMYYVHLHTNSQTTAACWVLTDGHNNIADRVVAKDAWDISTFNSKWESPLYWFGDPTDPTDLLLVHTLQYKWPGCLCRSATLNLCTTPHGSSCCATVSAGKLVCTKPQPQLSEGHSFQCSRPRGVDKSTSDLYLHVIRYQHQEPHLTSAFTLHIRVLRRT